MKKIILLLIIGFTILQGFSQAAMVTNFTPETLKVECECIPLSVAGCTGGPVEVLTPTTIAPGSSYIFTCSSGKKVEMVRATRTSFFATTEEKIDCPSGTPIVCYTFGPSLTFNWVNCGELEIY